MADRGPDTRQITAHLRELQFEASDAGGEVVVLVGNHEALLMRGDYRYLHPGEIETFRTDGSSNVREVYWHENRAELIEQALSRSPEATEAEIRSAWEERTPLGLIELSEAWSPEGHVGQWILTLPAVAIIDDTLFVHGGLSGSYAGATVEDINAAVTAALRDQSADRTAISNDGNGPLWYRGLHREPGAVAHIGLLGPLTLEEETDLVLESFGVSRIVVGHTPNLDGVSVRQGGKVIRIDTGMSAHYGGPLSFLEIENGRIRAWNDGVFVEFPNE